MANHIIFIIGTKPNLEHPEKSHLFLSDEGDTVVKPGDHVIWINMVASISSFIIVDDNRKKGKKVDDPNSGVFAPDPKLVPGSNIWEGHVRKDIKKGEEHYAICWSQDGMTYRYDPVIKVNT
jgi:hypothetical protein